MAFNDTQALTEQSRLRITPLKPDGVTPGRIDGASRLELVSGPGRVVADAADPLEVVAIYGDAEGDVSEFDIVVDADLDPGENEVREVRERVIGRVSETEIGALGVQSVREPRP